MAQNIAVPVLTHAYPVKSKTSGAAVRSSNANNERKKKVDASSKNERKSPLSAETGNPKSYVSLLFPRLSFLPFLHISLSPLPHFFSLLIFDVLCTECSSLLCILCCGGRKFALSVFSCSMPSMDESAPIPRSLSNSIKYIQTCHSKSLGGLIIYYLEG